MDEQLLPASRDTSRGQRLGACLVAAVILVAAAGCLPSSDRQLAAHPGFLSASGALSLLINGLTAGLLLSQARMAGGRAALRLGAGYLFATLITVPHLLASPGVVAERPLIGGDATAEWLWCACHVGFALFVIRFVWGQAVPLGTAGVAQASARVCLAVAGLALMATAGSAMLPQGWVGQDAAGLAATGLGPAIFVLVAASTVYAAVLSRCRTVLNLWLCVALLAGCLDVALTLAGHGRFTVGWYAAQGLSLVSGACMLFALLWELTTEARRIGRDNAQLEQMLKTDVLTGLANRRAFDIALDAEWRRAQREQTAISLLMIDIDSFKGFNDRYGHPAGDACLRTIGTVLADQAYRPGDVAARLGGEEFGIILPVTEEGGALLVAERLRANVASQAVPHGGSSCGHVTISIGAATIRPFTLAGAASQIVTIADTALYQAKAAGRDTVRGCGRPPRLLAAM